MQRNNAIDAVKGFAILLVMIGHCIVLNGLDKNDPYIYDAIKSIQMPLFMLVSGVLASGGLKKNGEGSGFSKLPRRAKTYLVPFFSWFALVHIFTHLKARTLSVGGFLGEWKDLMFQTDRGLWFLMTLFVATVCAMIAQFFADKVKGIGKKCLIFMAVSMGLYVLFFLQSRSGNTFLSPSLMLQYFPFYLMGYAVNGYGEAVNIDKIPHVVKMAGVAVMFVLFLGMVIAVDLSAPVEGVKMLLLQMTASIFGTVSVFGLVYEIADRYQKKTEKQGFLSFVGIYTLEIYVIHFRFARLLNLAEKNLSLYSAEGIAWLVGAFLLMSLLTAICIFVLSRIPVVSLLLFGKKHKAFR